MAVIAVLISIYTFMLFEGIILLNNPSDKAYPVRGVDVSAYQGDIDWNALAKQNISFAFIKATEGSSFVDKHFSRNWQQAVRTNLKIGAYHFFSFDSSGLTQAENFIRTVPDAQGTLPPVVDFEFYADKEKNIPDINSARENLNILLDKLTQHYHKKPIIYATMKTYDLYIKGSYPDYPIWIRDVLKTPKLPDNRLWTFWQYSDRGRLKGYTGQEKFIDLNVFYSSIENLEKLCKESY